MPSGWGDGFDAVAARGLSTSFVADNERPTVVAQFPCRREMERVPGPQLHRLEPTRRSEEVLGQCQRDEPVQRRLGIDAAVWRDASDCSRQFRAS